MRPEFDNQITLEQFTDHYWYKSELQNFCKKYDLPIRGGKLDLKARLEDLIRNNFEVDKIKIHKVKEVRKSKEPQVLPKSLDEKMPDNYSCSELYREFFKKQIGKHFHFTAYMIKYKRENPDITFQQYIDKWMSEYEKRKNKDYKPEIMKSTEYNQYIRDFFGNNKGRSLKDAIECWKYKKSLAGNNKYSHTDLVALN